MHAVPSVPLLVLVCSVACGYEEDLDVAEFRTTIVCPNCPPNSPRFNDTPIDRFDLNQMRTGNGEWITGIRDPGDVVYQLAVIGEVFWAVDGATPIAGGADLIGWQIDFEGADKLEFSLRIDDFDGRYPMLGSPEGAMVVYKLTYPDPSSGSSAVPVCPPPHDDGLWLTLIQGETYDHALKLVEPNRPGWITLACADEAVFKMKSYGYGPNDHLHGPGLPSTAAERQATLKMITADYCGDGHSFTEQGELYAPRDAAGRFSGPVPATFPMEAMWDEDGALCIGDPRAVTPATVAARCTLPTCASLPTGGTPPLWTSWDATP
jgi:hypothetical protein